MELQLELGTAREHDAIRMMEKFKKIAKQQKTIIDELSEKEVARSRITTLTTETQSSLTGKEMVETEMELTQDIDHLRTKLKKRGDECAKLKVMVKKYEKTEKKLRRIVQRSHEIIQAQEDSWAGALMLRMSMSSNMLYSEDRGRNRGMDDEPAAPPHNSEYGEYDYNNLEKEEEEEGEDLARGEEGVERGVIDDGSEYGGFGGTITMHRALTCCPVANTTRGI